MCVCNTFKFRRRRQLCLLCDGQCLMRCGQCLSVSGHFHFTFTYIKRRNNCFDACHTLRCCIQINVYKSLWFDIIQNYPKHFVQYWHSMATAWVTGLPTIYWKLDNFCVVLMKCTKRYSFGSRIVKPRLQNARHLT